MTSTTDDKWDKGPAILPDGGPKARLQRRVALASITLPAIGTALAVAIAAQQGIGILEISLLLVMYLATSIGVEVGMHRFFSHRSFCAGPLTTAIIAILGSMALQGPVLFWAAIHRKHHVFTDVPGDPHSPRLHGSGFLNRLRGLWHAHIGWMLTVDGANWSRLVPDLLRDRWLMTLNQLYPLWVLLGLLIPAAIGGLVTGTWEGAGLGFLWGGPVRIFLVDQVTWSVNSIGHMFGRQPNPTRGSSRNVALLSLPTFGGSWHNNHHAHPALARNDRHIWQFDPGGMFIELLSALGLAWNVRRAGGHRKSP